MFVFKCHVCYDLSCEMVSKIFLLSVPVNISGHIATLSVRSKCPNGRFVFSAARLEYNVAGTLFSPTRRRLHDRPFS